MAAVQRRKHQSAIAVSEMVAAGALLAATAQSAGPLGAGDAGGSTTCSATVDSTDPVHGMIREGPVDLSCDPVPAGLDPLMVCAQRCCGNPDCTAFSFNSPWRMKRYFGCVDGMDCCCLKPSAPDSSLKPNPYPQNITTGVVTIGVRRPAHAQFLTGTCMC